MIREEDIDLIVEELDCFFDSGNRTDAQAAWDIIHDFCHDVLTDKDTEDRRRILSKLTGNNNVKKISLLQMVTIARKYGFELQVKLIKQAN